MTLGDFRSTLGDVPPLDEVMNAEIAALLARRTALSREEIALLQRIFPHIMAQQVDLVWAVASARGLGSEGAANCVQETFARYYKSVVERGFPDNPPGLIRRIAQRKADNLARARKNEPPMQAHPSSSQERPASGGGVESLVGRAELGRLLFAELLPDQQVIARLAIIEDRPDREIAETLGLPLGTVKSRIAAVKRALDALHRKHVPESRRT